MRPHSRCIPRLRERLREETARAILDAAEQEFAAGGVHATRMESIAARAGVAVGTLYNHFADRDALVAALARSRRESLVARVDAALAEVEGRPVLDQIRAFLRAIAEHARVHGRYLAVMVQAGEGPGRPRPPSTLLRELASRADALVARGVASGELRPDRGGVFGLGLVGVARAVLLRNVERDEGFEGAVDGIADLFLRGAQR
jgi:AcrR family transcriptional regulator